MFPDVSARCPARRGPPNVQYRNAPPVDGGRLSTRPRMDPPAGGNGVTTA